jgi:hypothetical protein
MLEYCDCCGEPNDEPENWEESWELASWVAAEDFTS